MWGCSNMCMIYICNITRAGIVLDFHDIPKPFAIMYIHRQPLCKIISKVNLELKYSNYVDFVLKTQ